MRAPVSQLEIVRTFGLSHVACRMLASTKPPNPAMFTQRLTTSAAFNNIRTILLPGFRLSNHVTWGGL
jgi:hypothetical protein